MKLIVVFILLIALCYAEDNEKEKEEPKKEVKDEKTDEKKDEKKKDEKEKEVTPDVNIARRPLGLLALLELLGRILGLGSDCIGTTCIEPSIDDLRNIPILYFLRRLLLGPVGLEREFVPEYPVTPFDIFNPFRLLNLRRSSPDFVNLSPEESNLIRITPPTYLNGDFGYGMPRMIP